MLHPRHDPRFSRKDNEAKKRRCIEDARATTTCQTPQHDTGPPPEAYRILSDLTSDFAYAFAIYADGSASVEWVTDAFTRVIGYTAAEWQRLGGWRAIAHPDDMGIVERRLERLLAGEPQVDELRVITRNRETRWLRVYSRPHAAAQGRVQRIVGAAQDITQRRVAEDAKTMFLATASHELKTPLTVIQGFAETLAVHPAEPGMEKIALEAILRRSRELTKIVDRILLSSRIEAGRAQVAACNVDLAPILSERVRTLTAATARRIELSAEGTLDAFADPDAFTTVVDHLMDNAVKYSPGNEAVHVRAYASDTHVHVEVSDRGIGMTPEQVELCFEKFWQAESSDTRRFGGTGIGLFIVRSLVEGMGGRIAVSSAEGEGSTFSIALPLAREAGAEETLAVRKPGDGERSVIREFMRLIGVPERRMR